MHNCSTGNTMTKIQFYGQDHRTAWVGKKTSEDTSSCNSVYCHIATAAIKRKPSAPTPK